MDKPIKYTKERKLHILRNVLDDNTFNSLGEKKLIRYFDLNKENVLLHYTRLRLRDGSWEAENETI